MAWVVDTCVLLDIHCADPHFAQSSADCLTAHLSDGLVISPITYVELAPAFDGNMKLQEQFLTEVGVAVSMAIAGYDQGTWPMVFSH